MNTHTEMNNTEELYAGFFSLILYKALSILNFNLLQIQTHPILSEIVTDAIKLVFTVLAAGIGYLFVHYLKKNITKEVK